MATIPANFKQLILIQAGETDPNGTIATSMDALWDMYADKALIAPRLQYFYVLLDVLGMKIGSLMNLCSMADPNQAKLLNELIKFLTARLEAIQKEIDKLEKKYGKSRPPVIGQMTTTAPISPQDDVRTVGAPDANDRALRGDAYLGRYSGYGRII